MKNSFAKQKLIARKHPSSLRGDSLAIVLFLAAACISFVLHITENTPFVVGSLLLTLLCISICFIVRFVPSTIMRFIVLGTAVVFVCGLAIHEWPGQQPSIDSHPSEPKALASDEKPCDARILLSNIGFDYDGTAIKINGAPCITTNNLQFHGKGVAIDIGSPKPPATLAHLKAPQRAHHPQAARTDR